MLQYIGLWKTGINTFLNYPLFGVGPTNIQNYLEINIIQNFDPYQNNEHPHNHYIQAFSETGLFGGFCYSAMIIYLIKHIYITINNYKTKISILKYSAFVSSICLLWPFGNTYDLYGQQQNAFLWYCISLYFVIRNIDEGKSVLN